MTRQQRYMIILDFFRNQMPEVTTELQFGTPFQLLVATVLSAQCTDQRVNMVTPELFKVFPDPQTMAQAEEHEVYEYVKSVSYPNSKTKHLVALSRMIVEDFNGHVPEDAEQLERLPGVGRKTANVVQAVAFGKSTMAVDTHVYRVSHRMGLVPRRANTPLKVEKELTANIPVDDIPKAHHWLLLHGRYVCTSRKPHCEKCDFSGCCPKIMDFPTLR